MEHIYKYRHLYGFDEAASKLTFERKDIVLFASEAGYYVESKTQKGDYPRFSVLWTCRRLRRLGIFIGTSVYQTSIDLYNEITSGGLAIPKILYNIIFFNPVKFINQNIIIPFKENYAEDIIRNWKFTKTLFKLLRKRITTPYLILLTILSSATIYLCFRTCVLIKHDVKNEVLVENKVVLITGGNSGIGERLAYEFAERGAFIIIVASDLGQTLETAQNIMLHMSKIKGVEPFDYQNMEKGDTYIPHPIDAIHPMPHNQPRVPDYVDKTQWMQIDLGDMRSIWRGAYQIFNVFDHIDIIINCAAINVPEEAKCLTVDEFEVHFGVNYLGHFLLTNLLLGYMHEKKLCKIITVTCAQAFIDGSMTMDDLHKVALTDGENLRNPYATSKLCNYLFHMELTKRLTLKDKEYIHTYAVNPTECDTNLKRYFEKTWFEQYVPEVSAEAGMQTILHCALSPRCEKQTGLYYEDCMVRPAPLFCGQKKKQDWNEIAHILWAITEKNTIRLMDQIRDSEGTLVKADFYGNPIFEKRVNDFEEPYRPEPAREIVKFRNDWLPIYQRISPEEWKNEFAEDTVLDYWVTCHGALRFRPRNLTHVDFQLNRDRDLIYDPLPILRESNGWMYELK